MTELIPALKQEAAKDIDCNKGSKIPYVAVIVNSRPAGIHADLVVIERLELL